MKLYHTVRYYYESGPTIGERIGGFGPVIAPHTGTLGLILRETPREVR